MGTTKRNNLIKLTLSLVVVCLILTVIMAVPVSAERTDIAVSFTPSGGPIGTRINVHVAQGSEGFGYKEVVSFYWGSSTQPFLMQTTTSATGSLDTSFNVPQVAPGSYVITLKNSKGDTGTANFNVIPSGDSGSTESPTTSSGETESPTASTEPTYTYYTEDPIYTNTPADAGFFNTTNIAIIVVVLVAIFVPLTLLYMRRGGNRRDMYNERRGEGPGGPMGPGPYDGGYGGPGGAPPRYGGAPPAYGAPQGYGGGMPSPYARSGGYGGSPYARPAGYGAAPGGYGSSYGRPMAPAPSRYGSAPGGYGGGYGRPMGGMRVCPNCRTPVRDDQNICPTCRRRLR
ncbi:MAG: hypothetical protein NWF01_05045 [Candidatus Bathyarchaeota archaeon]|nr:hypothetical protein [Candidatus Bathyarchaeota archaeon]